MIDFPTRVFLAFSTAVLTFKCISMVGSPIDLLKMWTVGLTTRISSGKGLCGTSHASEIN